jgi:hypothetical protein
MLATSPARRIHAQPYECFVYARSAVQLALFAVKDSSVQPHLENLAILLMLSCRAPCCCCCPQASHSKGLEVSASASHGRKML